MKMIVGGQPGDFFAPRQLDDVRDVRDRGDFVVVRFLAETIQCIAGVQFGTGGKMFKVFNGNELAFGHTMDVHVGANTIFDAFSDQALLDFLEFNGRFHETTSK